MRELSQIFPLAQYVSLSTHQPIGKAIPPNIANIDYRFVCGTNLLKSNMLRGFRQWQISIFDTWFIKNVILFGCGWWQYQEETDRYSRKLWSKVLSNDMLHSVRDDYTKTKLNSIGIHNVVNTGCPTMWCLDERTCQRIPHKRAKNVVTTLTDYHMDIESDNLMLALLSEHYQTVFFWPQGFDDLKYLQKLDVPTNLCIINTSLDAYDTLLQEEDVEYIGTRLHGGIRALQHGKRTLIIAVDNRAIEKHRDFNLNVIQRNEIDRLEDYIDSSYQTRIKLNNKEIDQYRKQFI